MQNNVAVAYGFVPSVVHKAVIFIVLVLLVHFMCELYEHRRLRDISNLRYYVPLATLD
jgi:hypothetical protein